LRFSFSERKINSLIYFSGLFAGLAALTRGQFLLMAPVSLLILIYSKQYNRNEELISSVRWLTLFLVPIILWGLYSYIISGIFVIVSTQGMFSMWWGWSPAVVLEEAYPIWNQEWAKIILPSDQIGELVPNKSSGWFLNEVFTFITKYPKESFLIGIYKLMDGWGFHFYYSQTVLKVQIGFIKINWDLILAIPAVIIILKRKEQSVFIRYTLSACIVYSFVSILTAALYRYRFPSLDILFLIFSAYSIVYIYNHFIKSSAIQ